MYEMHKPSVFYWEAVIVVQLAVVVAIAVFSHSLGTYYGCLLLTAALALKCCVDSLGTTARQHCCAPQCCAWQRMCFLHKFSSFVVPPKWHCQCANRRRLCGRCWSGYCMHQPWICRVGHVAHIACAGLAMGAVDGDIRRHKAACRT